MTSKNPAPTGAESPSTAQRILEAMRFLESAEQGLRAREGASPELTALVEGLQALAEIHAEVEKQSPATSELVLLEAVDDERLRLYRVSGALRCIADALSAESPNEEAAAGAIELAADEVDRVNEALDRIDLLKAAKEQQERVEAALAASQAAREARS